LDEMDRTGVWRAGLVNYPSPDVMGFTDAANVFSAQYAAANPERLLPYGGVHPRFTRDATGDVDRLVDLGIRLVKIHPPHQRFPANAYSDGLTALGDIYRRCEGRGLPVMIHTGTSIFPGARSNYGNPLELDDVAIDFPDLRIVMAQGGRRLYMEEAVFGLGRHPRGGRDVFGVPPSRRRAIRSCFTSAARSAVGPCGSTRSARSRRPSSSCTPPARNSSRSKRSSCAWCSTGSRGRRFLRSTTSTCSRPRATP